MTFQSETKRVNYCSTTTKSNETLQGITPCGSKLVAHPKELYFKSFELNREYKKSIKVVNRYKKGVYFEVLQLPIDSEFKVELAHSQSSIIPGMAATIHVYLIVKYVHDKKETLYIREENGGTLCITLTAVREPPILTISGKELTFYAQDNVLDVGHFFVGTQAQDNVLDVGHYFVGSHNVIDVCFEHQGGAARYFVLSEEWESDLPQTQELKVLPTKKDYFKQFTLEPVYFALDNNKLIGALEFSPIRSGVSSVKLLILCDNGSRQTIRVQGHGVKFAKSHIEFEGIERKALIFPANVSIDFDDPSCEWLCDMGAIFTNKVKRTFTMSNVCPAKNSFSYEWRIDQVNSKGRTNVPTNTIKINPESCEFKHGETVCVQVCCEIPSEMLYQEAGFVVRLFCCLSRDAISLTDFETALGKNDPESNEEIVWTEENAIPDITSNLSVIIPYNGIETTCVCVAAVEFCLDCRRNVALSFNPCYIDVQSPLIVNHVTSHRVFVINECPYQLSCQWVWKTDRKVVKMKMLPIGFILRPYEKKSIEVRMKPKSTEPFCLDVQCLVEENKRYIPRLKIKGHATIGIIEIIDDIVVYENLKQGHVTEVPIEFKNYTRSDTLWHMYNMRESSHEDEKSPETFRLEENNPMFLQCKVDAACNGVKCEEKVPDKEIPPPPTRENVCCYSCEKRGNIYSDFKRMFSEFSKMCETNHSKHRVEETHMVEQGKDVPEAGIKNVNTTQDNIDTTQENIVELNLINLCKVLKCDRSELISKLVEINPHRTNHEEVKPIYTGHLSKLNLSDKRGTFHIQSEYPALEYKLLELRVDDCAQHKLIIADYTPSLVSLEPCVYDIGATRLNAKTQFQINIVNHTVCSWKYCWGHPVDINETELKFKLYKKRGTLNPHQTDVTSICVQPLSYCILEDVFVPCYIDGLKDPLFLTIKMNVEQLRVTISWETYNKTTRSYLWPDDRLCIETIVWCGLEVFQPNMKSVYREKAEESKVYIAHSFSDMENFGVNSNVYDFDHSNKSITKDVQNSDVKTAYSDVTFSMEEEGGTVSSSESGASLLYAQYRGTYSECLHFEDVQHKVPTKQTITVTNSTTNPCKFTMQVEYFKPRSTENAPNGYIIPTKRKYKTHWEEMVDNDKGLVIWVDNATYETTNQDLEVDVWVYANTWGLYMDTLILEFETLPKFHIPVSVAIKASPIRLNPLHCFDSNHDPTRKPVYNFYPVDYGSEDSSIAIPVENTSHVPVKVFWNNYGKEGHNEWPTSVALDVIDPESKKHIEDILPERKREEAFNLNDDECVMKLKANGGIAKLTVHFNRVLLAHITHVNTIQPCLRDKSKLFKCCLSGYIWVDAKQANTIGVYREPNQISCEVRALAGTTKLKFSRYILDDRVFRFSALEVFPLSGCEKVKTFQLNNLDNFATTARLSINPPFSITQVVVGNETVEFSSPVLLAPIQTMQVTVACTITKELFLKFDSETHYNSHGEDQAVCRKTLKVAYNLDNSFTSLPLEVQLVKPQLELTPCVMNFHKVYLGDTDHQYVTLKVTNCEISHVQMPHNLNPTVTQMSQTFQQSDHHIPQSDHHIPQSDHDIPQNKNPSKTILTVSQQSTQQSAFSFRLEPSASRTKGIIQVMFTPTQNQFYKEQFQFSTFTTSKTLCVCGEGTQDQKYRVIPTC